MFALVDCNNFYASCERLFRPDLNGVPIVVLSNNDGCIIARSGEAKALGIKMGVPFHQCRSELELKGVRWFSSNYALYGDISSRVMTTLEAQAPRMEVYSIDEAFLDMTGMARHFDLCAYGSEIRQSVYRHTGIRVGVGIGPSKTLAKLANQLAKRSASGVAVLNTPTTIRRALQAADVGDVWGVGRRLVQQLKSAGISTALDLSEAQPAWLKKRFSVVLEKTARELRGLSCLPLEDAVAARQQIVSSRSFGSRVTQLTDLQAAIAHHVSRAAEKLRHDGLKAGSLQIFIRTGQFNPNEDKYSGSTSYRFIEATDDSLELTTVANRLLSTVWRPGYRYAKAGVMLVDLRPDNRIQRDLFGEATSIRSDTLMPVIDRLNQRFPGSIGLARALPGARPDASGVPNWQMNRSYLSPAYTTQWDALPIVR